MKFFKTFHEARRHEADRIISRYWHFVEAAHEYERRSSVETTKPATLLSKTSTTACLLRPHSGVIPPCAYIASSRLSQFW